MGKKTAAFISLLSNSLLTVLKFAAGMFTGSISLLSEAFHSFGDLAASLVALGSVIESGKPADSLHQFGHGKFEDMAGFIEALLIVLSALFILYMGFEKIITKNVNHSFQADIAVYAMLFSAVLNFFVASYILKKGKETESNALIGDGHHLMADVYSSLAVAAGLLAVKLTGHYILDPIIGIMVGTVILKTGLGLLSKTAANLLDASLPKENLDIIHSILNEYKNAGLTSKSIKTSKSGKTKNIILVIYLPSDYTLKQAHNICDEIETRLETALNNTNVVIHAEPNAACKLAQAALLVKHYTH